MTHQFLCILCRNNDISLTLDTLHTEKIKQAHQPLTELLYRLQGISEL